MMLIAASMWTVDWAAVFVPSESLLEIVIRGTMTYLTLFFLMRFVLRRESGSVGLADLLMLVMIADASQNAMAANYRSVTEGVVLVATLIFWNSTLDYLAMRFPKFRSLMHPPPLLLVEDGKMMLKNMRRELLTKEELMTAVRLAGEEDLAKVHRAWMEGDGKISVILSEEKPGNASNDSSPRPM